MSKNYEMELNRGDKIVLKIMFGDDSEAYFFKTFLIVEHKEYYEARELAKTEGVTMQKIFGANERTEYILPIGGPLYNAVRNGKLGTWVSVRTHTKACGSEDAYAKYYIENIIRKDPPFHERIMKKVDKDWALWNSLEDHLVDQSIKLLDEQILLTVADYLSKGRYINSIMLLHYTMKSWSYRRVLNVIKEIKRRRLTQTYAYFHENKS